MMDEIKPALTPEPPLYEQLRAYFAADPGRHTAEWRNTLARDLIENTGTIIGREQTVVVAHSLLPDDSPYKITRADVASVTEGLRILGDTMIEVDHYRRVETLAAKLAAILPPD